GIAMDMLKESSLAIASSLREGDVVSLVTWSTDDAVILGGHVVDGPDDSTLVAEIEAIEAGGGTDLHGGLVTGYALAQEHYTDDAINRVVLVSDGGANAGVTDTEIIAQHAGAHDQDGIYMIGVGVGDAASYNDNLMDSVTDAGKGASVFIGNPDEAWARFGDDFVSTMGVAARDVQVRLELPPGFEIIQTSAEEWSEDPSEVEPQHLAPNDAMVFHQRIRTCAPQLLAEQTPITVTARYLDATTFELVEVEHSAALNELLGTDPAPLLKGSAIFAYAESLKAYKRADFGAKASALEPAKAALDAAEAALPGDPDLAEIREVIEALSL
ncbi:MAG: hypothetical protein K0V04_21835, partial [Deltaproteobacteria bacterium]|nr:hypothetical protein [Deltaproteobacteria bacterium]